jgi:4-hydroxy-tetrahydrodipicolinate reductase
MGSLIVEEALKERAQFELVGGLEQENHPQIGQPLPGATHLKINGNLKELLARADLLIEFTTPEATLVHARVAAEAKVPMVIGTTGLTNEQFAELETLAQQTPIFWSANMSIGLFILRKTIQTILQLLKRYRLDGVTRVSISETHHTQKKDAPSGTAKQLAQDVQAASGKSAQEIPIDWKREGQVVGLHTVHFTLGPERISLEHEALDRRVFAIGALRAAVEFHRTAKRPGWYTMDDLIQ